jgi:MFS family permease
MLAPYSIVMSVVAPLTGAWSVRLNPGKLAAGGFLLALAVIVFYSFFHATSPLWWLVAGQFFLGLAAALFLSPNRVAVMSSVSQEHLGTASGLMQVVRFLGLSVGTMVSSSVISGVLAPYGGLKGLPGVKGSSSQAVDAFIMGQRSIFIIMACLLFFGALLSIRRASSHMHTSGES